MSANKKTSLTAFAGAKPAPPQGGNKGAVVPYAGGGGYGKKGVSAANLTEEGKAAKKHAYTSLVIARGQGAKRDTTPYVKLHEAELSRLVFSVDNTGLLVTQYNHGTAEMPSLGDEKYIFPPGLGMLAKCMTGCGSKYEDGAKKEESEFKGYSFNMKLALGLPMPDALYSACSDIEERTRKAMEFLEGRSELVIAEAKKRPEAFATFKSQCKDAADADQKRALKNKKPFPQEKWQEVYDSHFDNGLSFGFNMREHADEQAGKTYEYMEVKMHTRSFSPNTSEDMPEEIDRMLKDPKNKELAPDLERIKRAYASGLKLTKLRWVDEHNQPFSGGLFDNRFNVGATVEIAAKFSNYNTGSNCGTTIYFSGGTTLYNTEKGSGEEIGFGQDDYLEKRALTTVEFELLKMFKANVKNQDGMTAVPMTKFLEKKKIDTAAISAALTSLVNDKHVINGKDANYFKLADPDLDLDSLRVEPAAGVGGPTGAAAPVGKFVRQNATASLPAPVAAGVGAGRKRPAPPPKEEEEEDGGGDGDGGEGGDEEIEPSQDAGGGDDDDDAPPVDSMDDDGGAPVDGDDDDDGHSEQSKQARAKPTNKKFKKSS